MNVFNFAQVNLLISFLAGIAAFFNPCILPLVPAYISYITGINISGEVVKSFSRWRVFFHALFFVLGFSVIFVLLGATATFIGQQLLKSQVFLRKIGGGLLILLGLTSLGLLRFGPILQEWRLIQLGRPLGYLGSFLVGVTFSLGWTPCVGPVLSGILFYAANQHTVREGIAMLMVFSLGLGIPFILASLVIDWLVKNLKKYSRYSRAVEIISAVIIIGLGLTFLLQ